jgi:hypothetical protein
MSRAERPVLLVGGIPGGSAEEVFRRVAPELGDLAIGLPDGETNARRMFVGAVAALIWGRHPDLQLVRATRGRADLPPGMPAGYDDFDIFRTRPGVEAITIDELFYVGDALDSYATFRRLREAGVIPAAARFQVSLPFPDDACREFTDNAGDMRIMVAAYQRALEAAVDQICEGIRHDDLVIQWDINWETIAIDHGDFIEGEPPMDYKPDGDPFERYTGYMNALSRRVPEPVRLGMHFCYGDLLHRHFLEPESLAACVRMANAACEHAGRRIDYVHMPVSQARSDDAYFAPLGDLRLGDATLYIGLIHYGDGVPGSRARLAAFRRHYDGPSGVATECGLGRRPPDQSLSDLLRLHRAVAEYL